jgi:hypothetical protein
VLLVLSDLNLSIRSAPDLSKHRAAGKRPWVPRSRATASRPRIKTFVSVQSCKFEATGLRAGTLTESGRVMTDMKNRMR